MDINKEISQVQDLLKIPVSDLEFVGSNSVEVYSGERNIGGIPCNVAVGVYNYDVSENVVNRLDWPQVFKENSNNIRPLIVLDLGRDNILCNH